MPKKPRKRPSGGAQLKASSKTGILIGWPNEQLARLDEACKSEGRTRANFFLVHVAAAVCKAINRAKGR